MKRKVLPLLFCATFALCVLPLRPALAQQVEPRGSNPTGEGAIAARALGQINDILAEKAHFSSGQRKLDSHLAFAAKAARHELSNSTFVNAIAPVHTDERGNVTVEMGVKGPISESLLRQIESVGGHVIYQSDRWGQIRASLPLKSIEEVADLPAVNSVRLPSPRRTNVGSLTSQGYVSHGANAANTAGYNGSGVIVGVLSDSASPARIAALKASGDLPANTFVLPGQDGVPGTDEGTAMMEIVHDLAPGAQLYFATAFNGEDSFADNIIALQAAGCNIIVDDVTYFDEGVFQDGVIAQAVDLVTTPGPMRPAPVVYLSSAGNSGNLTFGTSGTWEGDFLSGGVVSGPIAVVGETGFFHNFGSVASPQNYDVLTVTSSFISLKWSDPLGASSNDYDLFILNSTGTVFKGFSAATQNGTEDPFEFVEQGDNCGTSSATGYCPAAGDRIVVVLFSGAARALHVDTERGQLSIKTAGATFRRQCRVEHGVDGGYLLE